MKLNQRPSTLDDAEKPYNWRFINRSEKRHGKSQRLVCGICAGPYAAREDRAAICPGCRGDLPWRTVPWPKSLPCIDSVWVCFDYVYPVRQLIHRVKYNRDIACARLLGELAADRLFHCGGCTGSNPVLYPVPLARQRMLVRGFNQAVELSLPIAARLGLLIDEVSVYKPKAGLTQSSLDVIRRHSNTRGAFKHRGAGVTGLAVIVDDVITTGATVTSMARTLKTAGAERIAVWALAAA